MSDLAEFLLARVAEDEAWANAGHNGNTHQRRWSPARVLAECEAKRRIVKVCNAAIAAWPAADSDLRFDEVLDALALPYADHPDYRKEWRP